MTTSRTTWSILADGRDFTLTEADKAFFRAAFRQEVHDLVLKKFMELAECEGLDRSTLAQRLNVDKSQITRWISLPGNWRLDTVSDLMLAMHSRPVLLAEKVGERRTPNFAHKNSTLHSGDTPARPIAEPTKDEVKSSSSRRPTFVPAPA